jgi:hypothetical protein
MILKALISSIKKFSLFPVISWFGKLSLVSRIELVMTECNVFYRANYLSVMDLNGRSWLMGIDCR